MQCNCTDLYVEISFSTFVVMICIAEGIPIFEFEVVSDIKIETCVDNKISLI